MKKLTFCIINFLMPFLVMAQITDDFEDDNLNLDPAWSGMVDMFTTVNGELRSNNNNLNSIFYMSTPCSLTDSTEWRLDLRILFNTSSLNYVDVMLLSDSMNLNRTKNGYFIRLGGSMDEISLFKVKNGIETKIIDGEDGILNTSNNMYLLVIQRLNDSFVLKLLESGSSILIERAVKDKEIISSASCGIRIRQSTSSFFNKHFFDNLYIGPITKDSIAPVCDSLQLISHFKLTCNMNEVCDNKSLADPLHYMILQGNINPVSVQPDSNNTSVTLQFTEPFVPNVILSLKMDSIVDKSGNMMINQIRNFYDSKPDTAGMYDLIITELLVDPEPQVALPAEEYIELTNVSGKFLQLNGCTIHDPTSFKYLPNKILAPDSLIVLKIIPSLNNTDDRIWLENQKEKIIHKLYYTDFWYNNELKKEGGYSLEMIDYSQPCVGRNNWMASADISGGSPGRLNSVKTNRSEDILGPTLIDYNIENDSTLSFHFDEPVDSMSILSASIIVNGQLSVFKLKGLNPNEDIVTWIIPFIPNKMLTYSINFSGISDCSGNRQKNDELNIQWPSSGIKGQLIFNEILFNPRSGGSDFIELYNNSSLALELSGHFLANIETGGLLKNIYPIGYAGLVLKPFQYMFISEDTSNICMEYDCRGDGSLKIQSGHMPTLPDDQGTIVLLNSQKSYIDSLHYLENWHFPLISDNNGVSLERLDFNTNTNLLDNWHSAATTSGYATPGYQNSQFIVSNRTRDLFSLQSKTLSPDEDGFEDLMVLNYQLPGPDYLANIYLYDMEGRLIKHLLNNQTLGVEGILTWDGTDENTQKTPIGIYIIWIECIHPTGDRIRQKMSVVVAARI